MEKIKFLFCNYCQAFLFLHNGYYFKNKEKSLYSLELSELGKLKKLTNFLTVHMSLRHAIFSLETLSKEGQAFLPEKVEKDLYKIIEKELKQKYKMEQARKKEAKIFEKEVKEVNKMILKNLKIGNIYENPELLK